ncbi:hypothetical protein Bca4012_061415 [Brassica carinata]
MSVKNSSLKRSSEASYTGGDTKRTGIQGNLKDIRECINDIEKDGMDWVQQARAVARDRMFKAKSKKIGQLLNDSRDSLVRSLRETGS